jgi:hypothetical protein
MRIGWLLGWAVPERWFGSLARAAFPGAEHVLVPAVPECLATLGKAGPFDWVAGYSLGSLLLLREPARAAALGRVALLAPVFAFPSESGLGGRVVLAQLRLLARQVGRDVDRPVADFYGRSGLHVPEGERASFSRGDLLWGLGCLEREAVRPPMPGGWRAWCGSEDPLLDPARLRELDPSIGIVAGAGHHPAALLAAFAREAGA